MGHPRVTDKVIDYLDQHPRSVLRVERLAQELGITREQVQRAMLSIRDSPIGPSLVVVSQGRLWRFDPDAGADDSPAEPTAPAAVPMTGSGRAVELAAPPVEQPILTVPPTDRLEQYRPTPAPAAASSSGNVLLLELVRTLKNGTRLVEDENGDLHILSPLGT